MELEAPALTVHKLTLYRFRWVACQLDALGKCLRENDVRKTIRSLPRSLDETYSRILCNIEEQHAADAFRVLQWLAFSKRTMRLDEIAELLAFDWDDGPHFDPELRLLDPHDVLTACSSLVAVVRSDDDILEVNLAHFSVKEYLLSKRIQQGSSAPWALEENSFHSIAAQVCLRYLLRIPPLTTNGDLGNAYEESYPLAPYAAKYTPQHIRMAGSVEHVITLACELLQEDTVPYKVWRLLYTDEAFSSFSYDKYGPLEESGKYNGIKSYATPPPLVWMSEIGMDVLVRALVDRGDDPNTFDSEWPHSSALAQASLNGHTQVVEYLLQAGAVPRNVPESDDHIIESIHPLVAAAQTGHYDIVLLLLDKAIQPGVDHRTMSFALKTAAFNGQLSVARLLMKHGSSLSPTASWSLAHEVLEPAARAGNLDMVNLFVEDPSQCDRQYVQPYLLHLAIQDVAELFIYLSKYGSKIRGSTPLLIASAGGRIDTMEEVLAGSDRYTAHDLTIALKVALRYNNDAIVCRLIDILATAKGDKHEYEKNFKPFLVEICSFGNIQVLRKLLGRPLPSLLQDHNIRKEALEEGLFVAKRHGRHDMVNLLVESGAPADREVEAVEQTPLVMTNNTDDMNVVSFLLDDGADVNVITAAECRALEQAASQGHDPMVQLLLERGADPNIRTERAAKLNLPLYEATKRGHESTMELLLDAGADIDAPNPHLGDDSYTPFMAAIRSGRAGAARLLMARGARVSPPPFCAVSLLDVCVLSWCFPMDQEDERALKHNRCGAKHKDVKPDDPSILELLATIPGVNFHIPLRQFRIPCRYRSLPIHVAAKCERPQCVAYFLDHGVDINATDDDDFTPLQLAAEASAKETVKLLLDRGAKTHFTGRPEGKRVPDLAELMSRGYPSRGVQYMRRYWRGELSQDGPAYTVRVERPSP